MLKKCNCNYPIWTEFELLDFTIAALKSIKDINKIMEGFAP